MDTIEAKKIGFFTRLKQIVHEAKTTFKESGFRGVIKRYGWKAFAVFFTYYLVRDVTLYILLPYFIAKGIFN